MQQLRCDCTRVVAKNVKRLGFDRNKHSRCRLTRRYNDEQMICERKRDGTRRDLKDTTTWDESKIDSAQVVLR